MSLSFTHLPTHWDTGEAYTVIAFLDLLRDQLWETYGDDITAMLRDAGDVLKEGRHARLGPATAMKKPPGRGPGYQGIPIAVFNQFPRDRPGLHHDQFAALAPAHGVRYGCIDCNTG